jgi:hypothetical protein
MYFTRPRAAGPTVPTLVRAAVVAALALPVALPAPAAQMSLSQLPAGARFAQAPAATGAPTNTVPPRSCAWTFATDRRALRSICGRIPSAFRRRGALVKDRSPR